MAHPRIKNLFLCIGAQKAGTTWLGRMLERHPDVFFTPVKEIHYFDHAAGLTAHLSNGKRRSRRRKYYQRLCTQWHRWNTLYAQRAWYRDYMQDPIDDAWYVRLFTRRPEKMMAGEATPEYALLGKPGFAHIKRMAPGVRLIYIMRNPVTRAWSQILHYCRSNGLDATALSSKELIGITSQERFEALADYCSTLEHIGSVFPQDQIWVGFYEDIHADRLAALEQICGFIGVDFAPGMFAGLERRYNISQAAAMPSEVRETLGIKYHGLACRILEHVGRVPESWHEEFALPPRKQKTVNSDQ